MNLYKCKKINETDIIKLFIISLVEIALFFSGLAVITIYGNWQIAAGIFMLKCADIIDSFYFPKN